MRKKGYKGRCEKKNLSKSMDVCRSYDAIQSVYADILQQDENIQEIRCNVLLDGLSEGDYTSDFVCIRKDGEWMILKIDFESEEALYVQLCNQIIRGIATETLHEGDSLPSVRQLADEIGINMHTVNKAYSVLKQEGFLRLDRRRGAVIALDMDKLRTMEEMKNDLALIVARGICKNVGRDEIHSLVDQIYDEFGGQA